MTVSIVIATYGRPKDVRNLLTQIRQIDPEVEVIVVDQKQTAALSVSECKELKVNVIALNEAHLPQARNSGWRAAHSDIVLFLDDDVVITPQTLAAHQSAYTSGVIGVAGRVVNVKDILPPSLDQRTGYSGRFFTRFEWNFCSTRPQTVQFPYGCNMSFLRHVLEETSGFDTGFPPPLSAFEEVDLGLRCREYGQILFVPQAEVSHLQTPHGGARLDPKKKRQSYWYCYGRFLRKHVEFWALPFIILRVLPRALRDGSDTISSFLRGIVSGRITHEKN